MWADFGKSDWGQEKHPLIVINRVGEFIKDF